MIYEFSGGSKFNTLAQNGTEKKVSKTLILQGKGSDLAANSTQIGRAKRKMVSQKCVLSMIDTCMKGDTELRKSLWNTFHCQNRVYTNEGRLFGKYCKNRFCTLCCANRKADKINCYLPLIEKWPEPYFVTLTVKSVFKNRLRDVIKCIIKELKRIIEVYRKRGQRNKGNKLVGIRSLECNFNPIKRTYNPHFHIVVAEKWMADVLIEEWLKRSKPGYTNRKAQDSQQVGNTKKILIEVVKYGSKIFTEPQVNNKIANNSTGAKVYVAALKNIFIAMKGVRIFDRFGFNLPPKFQPANRAIVAYNSTEWKYKTDLFDWVNDRNERLTNFLPGHTLLDLLDSNVDDTLE